MPFPAERPRRLRQSPTWRRLARETELSVNDFILPLFVIPGNNKAVPVPSMPGVSQLSVDRVAIEAESAARAGVPGVLLFGVLDHKDAAGSGATDPDGLVPQAIRAIKKRAPDLLVWADVCLCGATDHGHCGLVSEAGTVRNDESLSVLARAAAAYAAAGADAVAPSDMMDGRVAAIRRELDAREMAHVPIVSYAAKYASAFYGPFREAADSAPAFGDRRSYQMDAANANEAVREVLLDVEEGADIVMVKPAGPYLDIVRHERAVALEVLTGIRRAGADIIITYYAKDAAMWLAEAAR